MTTWFYFRNLYNLNGKLTEIDYIGKDFSSSFKCINARFQGHERGQNE